MLLENANFFAQIEERKMMEEGATADDRRNRAPDLIQGVCKLKKELLVVYQGGQLLRIDRETRCLTHSISRLRTCPSSPLN